MMRKINQRNNTWNEYRMYQCNDCRFSSKNKSDYQKHLSTIKHTMKTREMKEAFPLIHEPIRKSKKHEVKETLDESDTMVCDLSNYICTQNPPSAKRSWDLVVEGYGYQKPSDQNPPSAQGTVPSSLELSTSTKCSTFLSWPCYPTILFDKPPCTSDTTSFLRRILETQPSPGTIGLVVVYILIAVNGTLLYLFYNIGF